MPLNNLIRAEIRKTFAETFATTVTNFSAMDSFLLEEGTVHLLKDITSTNEGVSTTKAQMVAASLTETAAFLHEANPSYKNALLPTESKGPSVASETIFFEYTPDTHNTIKLNLAQIKQVVSTDKLKEEQSGNLRGHLLLIDEVILYAAAAATEKTVNEYFKTKYHYSPPPSPDNFADNGHKNNVAKILAVQKKFSTEIETARKDFMNDILTQLADSNVTKSMSHLFPTEFLNTLGQSPSPDFSKILSDATDKRNQELINSTARAQKIAVAQSIAGFVIIAGIITPIAFNAKPIYDSVSSADSLTILYTAISAVVVLAGMGLIIHGYKNYQGTAAFKAQSPSEQKNEGSYDAS
jgi:hypothetical protein